MNGIACVCRHSATSRTIRQEHAFYYSAWETILALWRTTCGERWLA